MSHISNDFFGSYVSSSSSVVAGALANNDKVVVAPLHRPVTGNLITSSSATDSATGTAQLRISPTAGQWTTGGVSELQLGDTSHYLRAVHSSGMTIFDQDDIKLSTDGTVNVLDNGTSSYFMVGADQVDPIGSNSYGMNFGSGAASGSLNLFSNSSSSNVKIGRNTDGNVMRFYRNNPTANSVGSISVTATGTTYNTVSDRRAKKEILSTAKRDGASPLEQLKQINVYDYKFIEDDQCVSTGFLADELAKILPCAVTLSSEEGGFDMVDYSKLVPTLVAAVQELSAELDKLKLKFA
jgi:Chaperone of endosialidase